MEIVSGKQAYYNLLTFISSRNRVRDNLPFFERLDNKNFTQRVNSTLSKMPYLVNGSYQFKNMNSLNKRKAKISLWWKKSVTFTKLIVSVSGNVMSL